MHFEAWDISWPWFEERFSDTTIQLPVKFVLQLEKGNSRRDCRIYQQKKGFTKHACESTGDEFSAFVNDGPTWWNGKDWNGGQGSWSWFGADGAKFKDKAGFPGVPKSCYPIYWGGVGRTGNFEFRTIVADINGTPVKILEWGMLIDYSKPKVGKHSHT
jgi:hypothetical protein